MMLNTVSSILVSAVVAFSATFTSSFTLVVPHPPTVLSSPSTSTALFDSRKKQKIASRTVWLEKRMGSGSVTDSVEEEDDATATEDDGDASPGLLKNEQGLEYVQLVHPETSAKSQIYLYGGVVTSYQDKDGTEFIAVRPDAMMDGSKPISGGLSHCWPQFGPGAIQQHGFARNVAWTVDTMSDTSVTMTLEPNDYTKAIWDQPFKCTFTVTLQADQLDTKMMVENTGTEPWSFQAALHSYFTVSALDNLEIAGSWKGKEFLNKLVGENGETQTEERDVITITEEYDRVYTGVNDPVLNDKGTQKSLSVLNTAGWEDTVLWNPFGNEKMGYNNFVCVESVKFNPVELAGSANWVGHMSLKPSTL
jgi:glucose-6-phosphate 1-epimerase